MQDPMPPCGPCRTLADIGGIAAGSLVYFHNHGDPGPGVFPATSWSANYAEFAEVGEGLRLVDAVRYLEPLPEQGFYRVTESFYCCVEECREFEPDMLVQLAYDETANAVIHVPEWDDGAIRMSATGTRIDRDKLDLLVQVLVAGLDDPSDDEGDSERDDEGYGTNGF